MNDSIDILKMKEEAKELSGHNIVFVNGNEFSEKFDKEIFKKLSEDLLKSDPDPAKDIRSMFHSKSKVDKHGRICYGTLITCEECGAKNVTLFNINGRKLCSKCKKELIEHG